MASETLVVMSKSTFHPAMLALLTACHSAPPPASPATPSTPDANAPFVEDPSPVVPDPDAPAELGHGAGTGAGQGMAKPTALQFGVPVITGDYDKAIVLRYLRRNGQRLTLCYERQLESKPSLQGTVNTRFVITSSGAVTESTATGLDPVVSACVATTIKGIEFPKPSGAKVVVAYPLRFAVNS